ncbi:hypothetical protein AVEN_37264-1 [Araneus ventricosus]|uniref:Uncharacterized protein n=1 Tax=Araneus ventricosus TaxID=182803 RepID=A0A4Y2U8X3_ARAVE|nr:hypothetical protein AVEN_204996-1 [Araneus ventricosus]GBO09092.1 hypothetical protein AVEN_37264-1 [Araneus ventricosus]
MIRVGALMKFIKEPIITKLLEVSWMTIGGELISRIEEVRTYIWLHGSKITPHLMHQKELNKSIELPLENTEQHDLVRKIQQHRHTHTCKKNDAQFAICRFNFTRQVCSETRIVAHSSDDFIRSGRRVGLLKRRKKDIYINN